MAFDIGAGDGALARPLAERVDRVDAVEVSQAMTAAGRRRPGVVGRTWYGCSVRPKTHQRAVPTGLPPQGASLHWMDANVVLDRIARAPAPVAMLAIIDQRYHRLGWQDDLVDVIVRDSRDPAYGPDRSLPHELEQRGRLDIQGRRDTAPTRFVQPTRDYVEQFHSTASLARELMSPAEAARFDHEVESPVRRCEAEDGTLSVQITASIARGRPRTATNS